MRPSASSNRGFVPCATTSSTFARDTPRARHRSSSDVHPCSSSVRPTRPGSWRRARDRRLESRTRSTGSGLSPRRRRQTPVMSRDAALTVAGVDITHPDKVLLPARDGDDVTTTKADLARCWEAVAPTVLPHLAGRPLTLQRFPDGLDAGGFVQQDAGKRAPKGLHTVDTPRRDQKRGSDDVVHHP